MYLAEMPSLSLKITPPPGTYPVSSVYCVVSTSSVNKHDMFSITLSYIDVYYALCIL